jgi:uncharacterized protein (DUF433 family)
VVFSLASVIEDYLFNFGDLFLFMVDIVSSEGALGGKPRVEGTRVSAEQIFQMSKDGMNSSEIAEVLPTVTEEGVLEAIRFMKKHSDNGLDAVEV